MLPDCLLRAAALDLTSDEFRVLISLLSDCRKPSEEVIHGPDRLREDTGLDDETITACIDALVSKRWMNCRREDEKTLYSFDPLAVTVARILQLVQTEPGQLNQAGMIRPRGNHAGDDADTPSQRKPASSPPASSRLMNPDSSAHAREQKVSACQSPRPDPFSSSGRRP